MTRPRAWNTEAAAVTPGLHRPFGEFACIDRIDVGTDRPSSGSVAASQQAGVGRTRDRAPVARLNRPCASVTRTPNARGIVNWEMYASPTVDDDDADEVRGTPAFTTGGGGFAFEDRAGTWALSAMIAGQAPIGSLGVPSVIEFQQKVPATALDDMVITGAADTSRPRWFASIKSFDLLGTANALKEFVLGAWVGFLSEDFDSERDYVGFICGQARDDDWTSLLELIETVRNDIPERMAERIAIPGTFNATDRELWQAFKCPDELATLHGVDVETSPSFLLQRLVPLRMDFRSADSGSEAEAKQWCQGALAVGHTQRAEDLYKAALELVSRTRPSGGSIDWGRVQRELGTQFPLALRPDAAPDWGLLDRHTQERLDAVSDTMAHGLRLPRAEARRDVSAAGGAPFIYLTGPSCRAPGSDRTLD